MVDENRKLERAGVARTRKFLLELGNDISGILTTNYDLLVEYALGTKQFNYGKHGEILSGRGPYPVSTWRNPVTLTGSIPVAKLHGSISWDLEGRYTDGRRGLTGNALIVAPTPEKTPPSSLIDMWELAGRILERSKRLLVFGFAFNPYDEALVNHLTRHGLGLETIMLLNIRPNLDAARKLWPNAEVNALPPPPLEGSAELTKWLERR